MSPPASRGDCIVPALILGTLGLLVYAAWRGTLPRPSREVLRADAPLRAWTVSCAACHGPDGAGISNRGTDLTTTRLRGQEALRRLLDGPSHTNARQRLSDRQVEQLAAHLRTIAEEARAP